jgi:membrane protein implicated in regulation of membrane protease activity
MSTSQQLHILALVAFVRFFVGVTIGWTWYLEAVCWAVVVVFWTIVGVSWWNRNTHTPSSRHRCEMVLEKVCRVQAMPIHQSIMSRLHHR